MSNSILSSQLQQQFGFDAFRPGQEQTISQLLAGHSSLAIFPTGSGKSLCYQFTALQLPHLTLVVSPLVALMQDQLVFLHQQGIGAASIDASLSSSDLQQILTRVEQGDIKILMVSVERFKNERFRRFIARQRISMLVVDEAHCISEWGHNFRPDYLKLPLYCKQLQIERVLLLTATATKKVKHDMAAKFGILAEHIVQTGFYRANLSLNILPVKAEQKMQALLSVLRQPDYQGCAIVYVTQQETAEQLAKQLQSQGYDAKAYHAGMADELRKAIQAEYMQASQQIIVATIAFGMGVDKANIRRVIHFDLPKSIENYSQEIGRAGRDGLPSCCTVLASLESVNTLENFIYGDTPDALAISQVLDDLKAAEQTWELQLYTLSAQSDIRQSPLKTLLVQLELLGYIEPSYSYFAEYRFKFLQNQQTILQRFDTNRQEFLQRFFAACPGKKVWYELDLSACQQVGIEREKALATLEYLDQQGLIELSAKKMTEVYRIKQTIDKPDALLEQLTQYFAEKEHSEIKRIAALIRFLGLDRCLSHNLAAYFDDKNAPQSCGHCSVCYGQPAKLEHTAIADVTPANKALLSSQQSGLQKRALESVRDKVQAQFGVEPSIALQARFLAGISSPWLSKIKARQIPGFGACQHIPFAEIRASL